jgi:CRISPR-associated protein Cas5d
MSVSSRPIAVRIYGPLALFTRPEMKVERVSYEFITPSAARGVLEAVLWKPAMRWIVQRITVLSPIRFMAVKRNEVGSRISSDLTQWARQNAIPHPYFADDDRQQRNALVLCDVDYVVEAAIELTARAGSDDSLVKFIEMFRRRAEKGQHFQQPYLGCREFPASVALATGEERPAAVYVGRETDYGWVLHDVIYQGEKPLRPSFFQARMRDGVIEVPPLDRQVAS